MGMLRGIDEHELIASLEYQGKGTLQVDGQSCVEVFPRQAAGDNTRAAAAARD